MDDALSFFSAHGHHRGMMENRKKGDFRKKYKQVSAFPQGSAGG
jgi:hypothetical protein